MITATNSRTIQINGLSSDIKPKVWPIGSDIPMENGSIFIEMDTGKVYFYDQSAERWWPFTQSSTEE